MKYTKEQINEMAKIRMEKLKNNEYLVETLPNNAELYHSNNELRDFEYIKNANKNSRLFRVVFDD